MQLLSIPGIEQPEPVFRLNQKTGQTGKQVIEQAGDGRVPDNQDHQPDWLTVRSVKVNSLGRPPDSHSNLTFGIDPGVGNGQAVPQGC